MSADPNVGPLRLTVGSHGDGDGRRVAMGADGETLTQGVILLFTPAEARQVAGLLLVNADLVERDGATVQ